MVARPPRRRRRRSFSYSRPRRRSRFRGFFRRHRPKKIPLIPTIAFGAATVAGSSGGWSSPLDSILGKASMEAGIQSAIRNITGMKIGMPNTGYSQGFEWNLLDTINPFNMNEAVGLKGLIWGSIADMILSATGIKRKGDVVLQRLPFLRKFTL